ncbi:GNAT family N-acetyltransferase [Bacillus sp. V3-13]|uniref:GNAT family N-acetyltransferase n=1 Tax=Bacillus sp. V3-13 TaxID=2053728 RepID=UPI001158F65B
MSCLNYFIPVAIVNHKAVGYGWIQDYGPHLRTGRKIHRFHDLFVLDEYRNKGIGALLFQIIKAMV